MRLSPRAGGPGSLSAATLCLINRERLARHEHALVDNTALTRVATVHSREMVRRDYFEHVSPSGSTPARRILRSGYADTAGFHRHAKSWVLAENLATAGGYLATPARIVAAWMHSRPHRANILNPALSATGVGVALGMPLTVGGDWHGAAATYTEDFIGR
jgi:uncharacterized protein YkwD